VRRQLRDGHELANHTWTHPDLSLLDYGALAHELERTDQLLSELSGRRPAVIRPPYGCMNAALLQHAALAHQGVVLWDVHFQDPVFDSAGNAAHVLERIAPGSIVLGHDAGRKDRSVGIAAVPEVIREERAQGYEFVTASELLELDATSDPVAALTPP
jgi:peptidoglycan/xylan/chitin deacetylase (PgdA/CDA1 family)